MRRVLLFLLGAVIAAPFALARERSEQSEHREHRQSQEENAEPPP